MRRSSMKGGNVRRDGYGLRQDTSHIERLCFAEDGEQTIEARADRHRWNVAFSRVCGLTEEIRDELRFGDFLSSELGRFSNLSAGEAIRAASPPELPRFVGRDGNQDSIEDLNQERQLLRSMLDITQRQNLSLRNTLQLHIFRILSASTDTYEEYLPFYRYQTRQLKTKFRPGAGLFCSGLKSMRETEDVYTSKQVINHIEYTRAGSPFISVSDSPWRIHNIIRKDRKRVYHGGHVVVIAPANLRKLQISFARSTQLVEQIGEKPYCKENPNGVHYTTPSHWLVQGWIPEACIVTRLTLEEFEE
ncbi:uncharacterized protein B0I36DRAFT_58046 [Microdochium trichocladiopsis]|uniref:DUF7587 domain-containing protein n=1 Tax=Microdochium trichocladiopsis TaxID=1682393 RepID=A0A9P9BKM6_9PEZI|nr:uncharacterized protein B0I36DRAFT_58046 [Microdochium trichocladiopsis]KAH7010653.1 hypothetical protein B0I36DRAFT_58046 [Microdochium trichocladiopsis]